MIGRDEDGAALVGHARPAVGEVRLALVRPPEGAPTVAREEPGGVGDALMGERTRGLAEDVASSAHLAAGAGAVGRDRPQRLIVGDVDGGGCSLGVADGDLLPQLDVDRVGTAHPDATGLGIHEHPGVTGRREHGRGDRRVEGVPRAHLIGVDVVPDDGLVHRGVGEEHPPVVEGDGIRGVRHGIVVAGRSEGIEFGGALARLAQPPREERPRVGAVDDVVAGRGDRGGSGRGVGGGLELVLLEIDGLGLVDAGELAVAVGEEVGAVACLRDLARVSRGAHGVELADRGVDARVALPVAGLQGPHRGVDLGCLLRVEARPYDARGHDEGRRHQGGGESDQRAALHRSTPWRRARRRPPRRR